MIFSLINTDITHSSRDLNFIGSEVYYVSGELFTKIVSWLGGLTGFQENYAFDNVSVHPFLAKQTLMHILRLISAIRIRIKENYSDPQIRHTVPIIVGSLTANLPMIR